MHVPVKQPSAEVYSNILIIYQPPPFKLAPGVFYTPQVGPWGTIGVFYTYFYNHNRRLRLKKILQYLYRYSQSFLEVPMDF